MATLVITPPPCGVLALHLLKTLHQLTFFLPHENYKSENSEHIHIPLK